jgi:hypothetical protein
MVAKAIALIFVALGLCSATYGAEVHDTLDAKWAPRGDRTTAGWDITVTGKIRPGDDVTFGAALSDVIQTNSHARPIIVRLASPGGDVATSENIADLIVRFDLWTHVDRLCASSCFLIFMAGKNRTFSPHAKIGVHRAYQGWGMETPVSLATTMVMIGKAQGYSPTVIPPTIIAKLAGTPGTSISWLSPGELQQIGTTMEPPEAKTVAHTPAALRDAQTFSSRYVHKDPDHAAQFGGKTGVSRRWLDSYDDAYSMGTAPRDCDVGSIPDNDGCRAGALDYQKAHSTQ